MQALDARYVRLRKGRFGPRSWMSLVLAPWRLALTVLVSGCVVVAGSVAVTLGVAAVGSASADTVVTAVLLIGAFALEGVGFWVKERSELLLTVVVRQLIFRRLLRLRAQSGKDVSSELLTFPGQISQFAYVVDAAVSLLQTAAVVLTAILLYGANGLIAVLLIGVLAVISVRLIGRIGAVWNDYIHLEGERRALIAKLLSGLPRAVHGPHWRASKERLGDIRSEESQLLKRRVPLQMVNGFLDRGALVAVLSVTIIIVSFAWPENGFVGIGLLVGARYVYAAVQNNLVNFRVIRLAVPLMTRLDALEEEAGRGHRDPLSVPPGRITALQRGDSFDHEATLLARGCPRVSYVARGVLLSTSVMTTWQDEARPHEKSRLRHCLLAFGLDGETSDRLFTEAETLSEGEHRRAALAIAMCSEPDTLLLDDIFASLDRATREQVGARVAGSSIRSVVLNFRNPEFVPTSFLRNSAPPTDSPQRDSPQHNAGGPGSLVNDTSGVEAPTDSVESPSIPDGGTRRRRFRRTASLLFGWRAFAGLTAGAVLLGGAEVAFAILSGESSGSEAVSPVQAGLCALSALVGATLFFGIQYRAPIARLTALHERVTDRIGLFGSPRSSGPLLGRLGEDFSELQMDIPSTIAGFVYILVQAVMLIGASCLGSPALVVLIAVMAPLGVVVQRLGSARMMRAATTEARKRGDYLARVSSAGADLAWLSPSTRRGVARDHDRVEAAYLGANVQQSRAVAHRTALVQALVFAMSAGAAALIARPDLVTGIVPPATLLFFALSLAGSIQSSILQVQRAGVGSLTAERLRALEQWVELCPPTDDATAENAARLAQVLSEPGNRLVAIVGQSGIGKSRAIDEFAAVQARSCRRVLIAQAADDLNPDPEDSATGRVGQHQWQIIHSMLGQESDVLVFDETLNGLEPEDERRAIELLRASLDATERSVMVVLHSDSNRHLFDRTVVISRDA